MSGATIDPSQLLTTLTHILDSDSLIDEVGFIHPSQFSTFNQDFQTSFSASESKLDTFFWHNQHKLGISTSVLAPLYTAAKNAFLDALKRYRQLSTPHIDANDSLDDNHTCSTSLLHTLESDLMKHSRALVLLSCDFDTAWNFRKLIVSKKKLLPMLMDELLLSRLVLSYAPKSERAWSHRRFVIKTIAGKYSNLQEIVERESELVKTIAENSKMNYRAWNHRCWLVSYMSDSQVMHELLSSRDWAGLHVADNSCFHYRARLLLQMIENFWRTHAQDAFSVPEFHQIWKEELDWVGLLIRRYVGREALWLYRRLLSLLWMKHLAVDDQNVSQHCQCGVSVLCDIDTFIANEYDLFHLCTVVPDSEFSDYQSQATYSATYIMWLAKQLPLSFGVELKQSSPNLALRLLLEELGRGFLWDTLTVASS